MNDQLLRTGLLDLFNKLDAHTEGILLGGGYGLYLKQLHLADAGMHTLLSVDLWPAPRATQDLDIMLSAEVVADAETMASIRAALDALGYEVIAGSEYLQFVHNISDTQAIKIDLLTAQIDVLQKDDSIQADERRARPKTKDRPKLHAHPTDGAITLNDSPLVIDVSGTLSSGQPCTTAVRIPNPFNYLLMKLTAYRDRREDKEKDLGRHHAIDIFRIIAMLTEADADELRQTVAVHAENAQVKSCAALVNSDFSVRTAPGILAMRSHELWQHDEQIEVFVETIKGLFVN